MKIIIASDSYKESLSSLEVASNIEKGFKKVFPHACYEKVALADGGEGTLEAIVNSTTATKIQCEVFDPLKRLVTASYCLIHNEKTAVIEMAEASGLELVSLEERNPLKTTSYGFGQLIKHAITKGIEKLILGIGGSATNDAGVGMLQALGAEFFDAEGKILQAGAHNLTSIAHMNLKPLKDLMGDIEVQVACDVNNVLTGKYGASYVFSAQKGADEEMMEKLDESLSYFAKICQSQLKKEYKDIEGSGAAGGMGFALMTFLDAVLLQGIELVLDEVGLEQKLKGAALVITGEGRIDGQTIYGKTPVGVAKLAKKKNLPVIAIAGSLGEGFEKVYDCGIDMVFDITPSLEDKKTLFKNAPTNLQHTAYNIAKALTLKL